jgi:hypothetical protein
MENNETMQAILTDDDLIAQAEDLFRELDAREAADELA